ncbi:hypothetical protein CFOL_v3_02917 [Cephalotus follicularis]|uniref:Uncharacterized protein n=1 Tax=Cephalotus follicularis TaxID=3775 RepID=A0A1Q3AUF4_CEPFO|nr:hypothetical protein CFOL_v3_02917 [Cephalotus follicularis]
MNTSSKKTQPRSTSLSLSHSTSPISLSSDFVPLPTSKSASSPLPRFSLSRFPSELGCLRSLFPLHSAVAAVRMTSCLSTTSRSCRALSQGTLCFSSPSLLSTDEARV